jgi:hypothetical protein
MNKLLQFALFATFLIYAVIPATAQDSLRWSLTKDGGIQWSVKPRDAHMDHVEMSGFQISAIVHYGIQDGKLKHYMQLMFPMLRTIPNDTHASLAFEPNPSNIPPVKVNGRPVEEYPVRFTLKGILGCQSGTNAGVEIRHQYFPSTDQPAFIDRIEIINPTTQTVDVEIPDIFHADTTDAKKGVSGAYILTVAGNRKGTFKLPPGASLDYAVVYTGRRPATDAWYISPDYELRKRQQLVDATFSDLVFSCPDEALNTAFAFAKLRAVESIYSTKGGLMHGPGGGRYYAAIWANDQAEYANPFFPFLGNAAGNESAINAFRHFASYINSDYKPIPSSIVAEGLDYWNGAGDRGDMAMIAYGASRFALAYGDKKTALELWPLITWCLEYCKRQINPEGVVHSNCDELENRFPAGDANLNTSSLYYDALISASFLGKELGVEPAQLDLYKSQSDDMKSAIERYFGATMDGFNTYRYYKENTLLRAWICTPLTVGLFDRSKGTIDALFSEKLWTKDGLASQSGSTTFWDRATLYALRGVFAAGETKRALSFLQYYTNRRLLGEHVPYAVEAYPEGNQRHLSAESALFCRVFTEGLWGIRPVGFKRFVVTPRLPEGWEWMNLKNVRAFGERFDVSVRRVEGGGLLFRVLSGERVVSEGVVGVGGRVEVGLGE